MTNQSVYSVEQLDYFDCVCQNLQVSYHHNEAALAFEHIFQRPDVVSLSKSAIQRRLSAPACASDDPVILHALSLIRRSPRKDRCTMDFLLPCVHLCPTRSQVKAAFLRTCADIYWGLLLQDSGHFLRQTCSTVRNGSMKESGEAGELLHQMMLAGFRAENASRELMKKSNELFIASELPILVFDSAFAMMSRAMTRQDFDNSLSAASLLNAVLHLFQNDFPEDEESKSRRALSIRLNKHWDAERSRFPRVISVLFSIYGMIDGSNSLNVYVPKHTIFGCLEFFAGLDWDGFPDNIYGQMISTLVDGIDKLQWGQGTSLDEIYSFASIWEGISRTCSLHNCFVLLGEERMKSFLSASVSIIKPGIAEPLEEEDESHGDECRQLVLETWARFCSDTGSEHDHLLAAKKTISKEISFAFLGRLLHIEKYSDDEMEYHDEFEDTSIEDESFRSAAAIARVAADDVAKPLFNELIRSSQLLLKKAELKDSPSGVHDSLEHVCRFVRFSGCILADDVAGQTATMPASLLHLFQSRVVPKAEMHRVFGVLLQGLMAAAEIDLRIVHSKSPHCAETSPRVAANIADALRIVSATYLVNRYQSELAETLLGSSELAFRARRLSLHYGVDNILKRGFEPEVAKASSKLLVALSKASNNPKYAPIHSTAEWQGLLDINVSALITLPLTAIRLVGQSLARSCGAEVIPKILSPAVAVLSAASESKSPAADNAERTIAALNLLHGVGLVSGVAEIPLFLVEAMRNNSGIIPRVHSHFADSRPEVGYVVLETVRAFARAVFFASLEKGSLVDFAESCVHLICVHCETIRRRSSEDNETTAGDIVIILDLCEKLVANDIDAKATFTSMNYIFRIVSHEMVAYPHVLEAHIQLIGTLIRKHTAILPSIPESSKEGILESLKVALNSYSVKVHNKGLEALSLFVEHTSFDSSKMLDQWMKEFLFLVLRGLVRDEFNVYSASLALLAILQFRREQQWVHGAGLDIVNKEPSFGPLLERIVPAATAASEKGALHGVTSPVHPNMRRSARAEFAEHVRQTIIGTSQV